jgi:hypothetical protein
MVTVRAAANTEKTHVGGTKDILSYLYFYHNKIIIESHAKFKKVLFKLIIQNSAILWYKKFTIEVLFLKWWIICAYSNYKYYITRLRVEWWKKRRNSVRADWRRRRGWPTREGRAPPHVSATGSGLSWRHRTFDGLSGKSRLQRKGWVWVEIPDRVPLKRWGFRLEAATFQRRECRGRFLFR